MSRKDGQLEMVEAYLRSHPWSTVGQVREGIAAEHGIRIERVQARVDDISYEMEILRRDAGHHDRVAYAIGTGKPRQRPVAAAWVYLRPDGSIEVETASTLDRVQGDALADRIREALGGCLPATTPEVAEEEHWADRLGILWDEPVL